MKRDITVCNIDHNVWYKIPHNRTIWRASVKSTDTEMDIDTYTHELYIIMILMQYNVFHFTQFSLSIRSVSLLRHSMLQICSSFRKENTCISALSVLIVLLFICLQGGIMSINIHWECNLDFNFDDCKPHYAFHRLDNREARIAKGWNFRWV